MSALKDGQTILFVGDSITDCGRRGDQAPLGSGYVALFRELMIARYPDTSIDVVNKGIGGNTVDDLDGRWEDDVARHTPDWLSIKIGINDLHRTLGNTEFAVPAEDFYRIYDRVLERTFDAWTPNLILVSPFYISRDTDSGGQRSKVLEMLPSYIEVVEKMAAKYSARYVPTHDIFQKHLEIREPDDFCAEPVHPARAGHLVIAEAIMDVLEA
jgi:lysophospholipase L1-like esterase